MSRPRTVATRRCWCARNASAAAGLPRSSGPHRSRCRTIRRRWRRRRRPPRKLRPRSSDFAMSISRQDIEKVALLARLQLTDDELSKMTVELAQIVGYVDQLGEVDTDGIEPMAHPIEKANVFRNDVVAESLPRDEALANAPHRDERGYLVPAVLGE